MLTGELHTVFGWTVHVGPDPNPRSLRNFCVQANAAEMLRLACCELTEAGILVCCPVHDAILAEAPLDQCEDVATEAQQLMRKASEIVLSGFPLRTDVTIVRYPDRYRDPRGATVWNTVCELCGIPSE